MSGFPKPAKLLQRICESTEGAVGCCQSNRNLSLVGAEAPTPLAA
jgi:hypothetical protein